MAKIEGGCLCGAVRYSSDDDALTTSLCHCKHCQKQAGTAFSVVIAVFRFGLDIQGELTTYEDVGDSGQPVLRQFCGKCGSPVISDVVAVPDVLFIKAGTLDDTSWIKPDAHIWSEHKQDWLSVAEELKSFPRNPSIGGG